MPSGSRASTRSPVLASNSANANMPRNRLSAGGPPGAPGLEHDVGVGVGGEPNPVRGQLGPQRRVVVKLAVVDEGHAAFGQRLVGRGTEVDDREPPVAELHRYLIVLVAPGPRR